MDASGAFRSGWLVISFTLGSLGLVLSGILLLRNHGGLAWQQPLSVVAVLLMTLLFVRREGAAPAWVGLLPRRRAFWLDLLLGAVAGAGLVALATGVIVVLGGWQLSPSPVWRAVPSSGKWLFVVGLVATMSMVSFQEELLCRGFPLAIYRRRAGTRVAILATSCTFAVLHVGNPGMGGIPAMVSLVNIALAGGLLAYLAIRRGSLGAAFGFHAAWNLMQVFMGSAVSGNVIRGPVLLHMNIHKPIWLIGGAMGFEGSLACTVVLVFAILGATRWVPSGAAR
jgi:hypothetical protein